MAADTAWTTRRLATHGTGVRAITGAVLRGEPVVVTAGDDGEVRLWSPTDGELRLSISAAPPGKSLGRPDPTALAAGGGFLHVGWEEGLISRLDLGTGLEPTPPEPRHDEGAWVTSLATFADADGRLWLASAATDGTVRLWD